jgi:hypothetical protein
MTSKQFAIHECHPPQIHNIKTIPVVYYLDCSTNERQQMLAVGTNGTRYYFVIQKPKAIPFIKDRVASDDSYHDDDNPTGSYQNLE